MKVATTAMLLASTAMTTIAQAQTYEWEQALCSYKGEFNSKKYTTKQVDNSYYMPDQLGSLNLDSLRESQSNAQLHQMSYRDIAALDIEYIQVKNNIEHLQIVPKEQTYKQDLLKSIEGKYTTNKLMLLAYVDPAEAIKQSPAMCATYIEPLLQSESTIQDRWRQAVEDNIKEQAKDYADDPYLIKSQRKLAIDRYQEEKATNAFFYAHKDLTSYHFNSCVVNKVLFGKSFEEICDED